MDGYFDEIKKNRGIKMKALAIIDMPKNCGGCPFLRRIDNKINRGKCYFEKELYKFLKDDDIKYKRNENCPLTEYEENTKYEE